MFRINYDALGIATSLACAIHCAILPLVLTSLPVLGINIIENVGFEFGMIILAMVIGFYSLWHGYRQHHHGLLPSVFFGMGIILLFLKQVFHSHQLYYLVPAVLLIVAAHLTNYRECRKAGQCAGSSCKHE
jgi:ribose/xylose/arabinose/galactoside ABC-type transport system permease subunit